jgi:hypothetical protein
MQEYYSAGCLAVCHTWVDIEDIMLSEINQKQLEKYCMILPVSGILKNKIE